MSLAVLHLHSPIGALIADPAPHVSPSDTLTHVSQVMRVNNISAVLVGPNHDAVVTERDLTRALARQYPATTPAAEVATPMPITVDADTEVLEAAALMLNQEVRHLVVELPDGSCGIVSLRAIMAVLLQAARPDTWLSSLRIRVEMPRALG